MTHPHEETNCVASKDPYKNIGSGDPCDAGTHCVHWWDGEACCWCGDDHCAAAKPIPRWDVHFGEIDDDRKDSTAPHITFRPQLGGHR